MAPPCFVLASKLKHLKADLRNKEVFGHLEVRKKALLEEIQTLDGLEEERELAADERARIEKAKNDLAEVTLMQEISWRQKSMAIWLKEGDHNTGFFPCLANSHRRNNFISSLCIDGIITSKKVLIKDSITQYFSNLLTESAHQRPKLDGLEFPCLDSLEAVWLERPFQEEEVFQALLSMEVDKAPGPNGFAISFFRACWSIVKVDLMNFFHKFHEYQRFVKSLNATFITLITKKLGHLVIRNIRPISLIGSVYKILVKALARRLQLVVGALISKSQNAFIGACQILDSALIANEYLNSRLRSGIPGVLCKLDLEKAFDHLNWDFIYSILMHTRFGSKWRKWISVCISTARFSILINGNPHGIFNSSRGLHQGDPLSPLLFVLVIDAFSRMLSRSIDGGFSFWLPSRQSQQFPL
jgi:hypothetical protein